MHGINIRLLIVGLSFVAIVGGTTSADDTARPNILWLFAEDTSPWMGCYGHEVNQGHTPNIDGLAERGVRFARAYVPAPVCSPCRSAMMGGQNQIRFNAHEHRSSRGPAKISLPEGMKLLPQLMKESGYYTFNCGKDDYNFVWDKQATYSYQAKRREQIPWAALKEQQPFFGQVQTAGGKNNTKSFPAARKTDPASVTVPADYPQNELYHEVVAQHYDAIRKDDDFIGTVLEDLEEAGLAENTIVVYFGDHGANNLVRHKQMPTEGGLHVPFIIAGAAQGIPVGEVRDDLVNLLDLSATTLAWGGVARPQWYEGQDLFGDGFAPRSEVFAAKDRLDHTIDRVRTVRSDRFRYTRNYKLDRIFLQPQYRDGRDFLVNLRELYASGELSPRLTEIYFGERPADEFYDVEQDPAQVHNLINEPQFQDEIARHRALLDNWIAKGDYGEGEESLEELAYQAQGHKWGEAVNPEYEVVRKDSDGDGLSDPWEGINGRDPEDGRLLFTFDCGGWQTEGWRGENIADNIAGRQGFLDFHVPADGGVLVRDQLQLNTRHNQGFLVVRARSSAPLTLTLVAAAGGRQMQSIGAGQQLPAGEEFSEIAFPLSEADGWTGYVDRLRLSMAGDEEALVEIDSMHVAE